MLHTQLRLEIEIHYRLAQRNILRKNISSIRRVSIGLAYTTHRQGTLVDICMIGEAIEDNVHKWMIPFLQILAHIAVFNVVKEGLIATGTLQQLNSHLKSCKII